MDRMIGIIFVLIGMFCEAFGNIAFKHAAEFGHNRQGTLAALAIALRHYKSIFTGVLCFAAEAIFWTLSLRFLDVSQAYPISSIELIVVLLLSRVILKEKIDIQRWAGVALIGGGTILVGLS
jgi:drug/metabolite transporter (DMT)-like permease